LKSTTKKWSKFIILSLFGLTSLFCCTIHMTFSYVALHMLLPSTYIQRHRRRFGMLFESHGVHSIVAAEIFGGNLRQILRLLYALSRYRRHDDHQSQSTGSRVAIMSSSTNADQQHVTSSTRSGDQRSLRSAAKTR